MTSIPSGSTITTIADRLAKVGDPWQAMNDEPQSLEPLIVDECQGPRQRHARRALAACVSQDAGLSHPA